MARSICKPEITKRRKAKWFQIKTKQFTISKDIEINSLLLDCIKVYLKDK